MLYSPRDELDDLAAELNTVTSAKGGILIDSFIRRTGMDIAVYDADSYQAGIKADPLDGFGILTLKSDEELDAAYAKLGANDSATGSYGISFKDDFNDYVLMYFDYGDHENLVPRALANSLPALIALVLGISFVSSLIYARLFAHPVRELSRVSKKMAAMDLSVSCDTKRRDEIGDLARDLNLMSAALDRKIRELEDEITRVRELEGQKEMFFAAASHELKTPVTILEGHLRGMIEGVEPYTDHDEYLARSLRAVKRMQSLIGEILTASKMQSADDVEMSGLDMAEILTGRLAEAEELLSVRNLTLVKDLGEGLWISGNRSLTELAVGTFISNAVFYAKEGSGISVSSAKEEDMIVTRIRNTDAHIDESDLEHLFEAFYRADSSRSRRNGGSGLGLYLAKLIITKENGSCSLANDGDGVLAVIRFPSTQNP